jgi:hypothetical protein
VTGDIAESGGDVNMKRTRDFGPKSGQFGPIRFDKCGQNFIWNVLLLRSVFFEKREWGYAEFKFQSKRPVVPRFHIKSGRKRFVFELPFFLRGCGGGGAKLCPPPVRTPEAP